ncbi:hypothetical protein K461DRAFT_289058 [Myriangium duriaei CBS 260.36]|uniref:B-block binding subunit of TFIIIC domain-containing protein n=1 Tax=Myriangium duriaei CBS 260.36 TaxID=1168546 RepID=A0A9P4J7T6_9PEZI|nr:hypothetical protein K461DRAFT_289058 [Myriangium duriaei CBS 260.36]
MTSDSDGLIDHILFSVALSGSLGLDAADFTRSITEYHQVELGEESAVSNSDTQDLLLSATPPKRKRLIDSKYLESTWAWITDHKDISQKHHEQKEPLSGKAEASSTDTGRLPEQSEFLECHAHDKLYTTENRIWQTVAGHGVDWRKLPKMEFQCLCVIAAHGQNGIIQPDIVALTGQDKRSVPKRTDSLAAKGYITKETVQGSGTKTSLLRLKRFFSQASESGPIVKLSSSTSRVRDSENLTPIIRYEQWFAIIMRLLVENDGVVSYGLVRQATGAVNHRLSVRALNRFTWRLVETGLIERVYAAPSGGDQNEGDENVPVKERRTVRAIRLLREPSQVDRDAFMTSLKKDSLYGKSTLPASGDDAEDLDEEDGERADVQVGQGDAMQAPISSTRPLWSPDLPSVNVILDVIDSFGAHGGSSTEVCEMIGTSLWHKPFDDVAARLTDQWLEVQPLHLRHLSIVRDTRIQGTITHYTFRTLQHFQSAVELGHASWEYVLTDKAMVDALETKPDLDEWGFPVIHHAEFFGKERSVAVTKCAQDKMLFVNHHKSNLDTRVLHQAGATEGVYDQMKPTPDIPTATEEPKKTKKGGRRPKKNGQPTGFELKRARWLERYQDLRRAWSLRAQTLAVFYAQKEFCNPTTQGPSSKRIKIDREKMSSRDNTKTPKLDTVPGQPYQQVSQMGAISLPEKRGRKRKTPGIDDPGVLGRMPVPDDRINALTQEILSLSRPGVYINEPRATMVHRDIMTSRGKGRPKGGCVLTFKSSRLAEFTWFTFDPTAAPSHKLLEFVPLLAEDPHVRTEPEALEHSEDDHIERVDDAATSADVNGVEPKDRMVLNTETLLGETLAGGSVPLQDQRDERSYSINEMHKDGDDHVMTGLEATDDVTGNNEPMHIDTIHDSAGVAAVNDTEVESSTAYRHKQHTRGTPLASVPLPSSQDDFVDEDAVALSDNHIRGQRIGNEVPDMEVDGPATESHPAPLAEAHQQSNATPSKQLTSAEVSAGLGMFDMVNQSSGPRKPPRVVKRRGVTRAGGLVEYQRAKLVLDIVNQCGGVFPGRIELYYPFASVWQQRYGQIPDRHTLARSLKNLLASGKLNKITFAFQSIEGFPVIKTMITEPQIDPTSLLAKQMQHQMEASWPAIYLPPEAPLTKELRQRFEERKEASAQSVNVYRYLHPVGAKDDPTLGQRKWAAVKLGMTEQQVAEGTERRRQQRRLEMKREAELKWVDQNALDEDAQHMLSEFQLDSYKFTPEARVDRGPYGRKRIARLLNLGDTNEKPKRGPSLGTLQSMKEKQKLAARCAPSVAGWYADMTKGRPYKLTLEDPQQPYHATTGTFATIPIQFTTAMRSAPLPRMRSLWPTDERTKATPHNDHRSTNVDWSQPMGQRLQPQSFENGTPSGKEPGTRARSRHISYGLYNWRENRKRALLPKPAAGQETQAETSHFIRPEAVSQRVSQPSVDTQRSVKRVTRTRIGAITGVVIRDPTEDVPMTGKDQTRLLYAMAVVKTLAGGLQQGSRATNFAIVNQCLHFKFDGKYCREHWNHIKAKHASHVEQLQERFRKLFLSAYDRSEIPEIHLATPEKIDWAHLVDWFEAKITGKSAELGMLPDSRAEFDVMNSFDYSIGMYSTDKGAFFGANVSSVKKDDIVNSCGFFDPLPSTFDAYYAKKRTSDSIDLVAQSWIRANTVTPTAEWDGVAAHRKLDSLGANLLGSSTDSMLGQKILKGAIRGDKGKARNMPGRDYIIADQLDIIFPLPKHWDFDLFTAASRFKQRLDTAFATTGSYDLRADSLYSNAETMAVLNLVDHGRIEIEVHLPSVDNNNPDPTLAAWSKWGFTRGDYKTMSLAKGKLTFPLSVRPTNSYVQGTLRSASQKEAPLLPAVLQRWKRFPTDKTRGERLPFWTSIHGSLIPDNFSALLLTFLYLLTQRPGTDAKRVAGLLKNRFWEWEVQMLGEWAEGVELVEDDGEGWRLGEWWWLAGAAVEAVTAAQGGMT